MESSPPVVFSCHRRWPAQGLLLSVCPSITLSLCVIYQKMPLSPTLSISLSLTLVPLGWPKVTPEWPRMTPGWPMMTLRMTLVTQNDPCVTQNDPWVTQDDPELTKDDPYVTQDDPWVTQSYLEDFDGSWLEPWRIPNPLHHESSWHVIQNLYAEFKLSSMIRRETRTSHSRCHTWRILLVPDWNLGGLGHPCHHESSWYVILYLCVKF